MKSLKEIATELVANRPSTLEPYMFLDKNLGPGGHCYVDEVYEGLFAPVREYTQKILEIGVHHGGSMLLWERYFPNAEIHGVDITPSVFFWEEHARIKLKICDAYTTDTVDYLDNNYDIIIDNGAHTLDSMRFFVKNYLAKLSINGIAVIEDIPDPEYIKVLMEDLSLMCIRDGYRLKIHALDLRNINMRYDDMILVIQKIK